MFLFLVRLGYRDEHLETNLFWIKTGHSVSWGLNMWRELLLCYRNFGSMSPHPEEMLHIYSILVPFAPNRRETSEIAAVLQDSLSGKVVPIELLYLRRISLAESTCLEKSCSSERFTSIFSTERQVQMECRKIPWTF